MRSPRRRPLLVPVLLCALAVLGARPTDGRDGNDGPGTGLGPQVARLYEDAANATRQYEDGRREAEAQRSKALEYERRLDGQRRKIDAMHEDLGGIARAQYRTAAGSRSPGGCSSPTTRRS
ncbi:M23 family metallopeptidase [Streptomyces violaceorubidus]